MAPTTQNQDSAPRHLTTTSGDYSQSNSSAVRKYLGLYGLTPPNVESYEVQAQRCTSPLLHGSLWRPTYSHPRRSPTSGNEAHAH
jgi:hypothetical protein